MKKKNFAYQYGPWALVAGGSDGIGRAFSLELARRGLNVIIVGRREHLLRSVYSEIKENYPVQVKAIKTDLRKNESRNGLMNATAGKEIGLLVYNAAMSPIGEFIDTPADDLYGAVETNCLGPLSLVRHYASLMKPRGKGGVILMSSMTAFQGTPLVAAYGATKAFNLILAEGIGYELSPSGIDVLACCAGATLTSNYINSKPDRSRKPPATEMTPEMVVEETMKALGKKRVLIPGRLNRIFGFILSRLLPRKLTVSLFGKNMYSLYKNLN
ncbi:MAG TPA: SDR family NAD(P)-dependent oxidoreductase [Spirochaetota bacterium]|nr:SDR family NAD(P)-dependent oxidoreductase [Spirochaetota bacterium]HPR47791.1 SDR family NAD(P)-dependent oxidoreductase [Spirochaetota bacterium]